MFDLALHGTSARLTLDRPEARNAIPLAGWIELRKRAAEAAERGARLLIVAGAGSAFCAGADLGDFPSMHGDREAAARFREAMRHGIEGLASLQIPTVAAIDGPCFGAGVALAMACDLRVAGPRARFAITPAKYGISYPQEDVARLVGLVGRGQAARLLLGAGTIDAAEAMRIGLVDLHAPAGLEPLLADLAATLTANSAASLAALKRGIALAAGGAASDAEQDRSFDALMVGDELAHRLRTLRAEADPAALPEAGGSIRSGS
jgi:enoyl-CoA hydratase/carnithine racemase